jgi:hypothetical protein
VNKKLLLVLILFSAVMQIMAQDKIVLHGKITNQKDVEGIHILNTSSRYNSITDAYGNFAITVRLNDTLIFSSVNYTPQTEVVSPEIFEKELLIVVLTELVNELDEVILGPDLSGNLRSDLEKIPVKDQLNFDDVGLPGFKGKPEEKIPNLVGGVITPLSVNLEGLYKYLSGYYRKLRVQREWDSENITVALLLDRYSPAFFFEAYKLPEDRLYDFLLFCIETTTLQQSFKASRYEEVLSIFEQKSVVYLDRMLEEKE